MHVSFLLLPTLLAVGCAGEVNPIDNVHFVDLVTSSVGVTNLLFRGSEPVEDYANGTGSFFCLPDLLRALRNASDVAGISFPNKFKLVDVTLIHNDPVTQSEDFGNLDLEVDFFAKHPEVGELVYWETMGNDANASTVSEPMRDFLALQLPTWQGDRLDLRVQALRHMLTDAASTDLPRVVYVHCEGGKDRTGELIGSYYLRHLGWSYEKVLATNYGYAGRPIGQQNQRALQWYCLHLNATGSLAGTLDCMREAP